MQRAFVKWSVEKSFVVMGVAALFLVAAFLQKQFFYVFSIGPRATLFYLPAAVITLGALISPGPALGGIFIGAFVANILQGDLKTYLDVILISLVPSCAATAAVFASIFFNSRFRTFHQATERFSQIDAIDIFYFCGLYALMNGALSEALYCIEFQDLVVFQPAMILGMAFGDLTGSFLVFILLNVTFSIYLRVR